jgi:heme o synthase
MMMTDTTAAVGVRNSVLGDYFALLKPRVMSLVVFTAATGLFVAPGNLGPVQMFAVIFFIALGGGASGALNMWWDADIDAKMRRTVSRPVPAGRLSANSARNLGLVLSLVSVVMLGLVSNAAAAALLAFTIFFYVVIYTMWLKRTTPWNIVIGGAAGAFPPMIGWVAATGSLSFEAVLLFGLIFIWTPPHFWALSLFMNDDYTRAKVPMLTVTHGRPETRWQIFLYTLALLPISLGLAFTSIGGPLYLLVALGLNVAFVKGAIDLRHRQETVAFKDRFATERRFFKLSLLYLFALFVGLLIEIMVRMAGFGIPDWPVLL